MTKYLLLLGILHSHLLLANDINAFEAELRQLELNEDAAFKRAEAITESSLKDTKDQDDMISDSITTTNAAVQKSDDLKVIVQPDIKAPRVRSR